MRRGEVPIRPGVEPADAAARGDDDVQVERVETAAARSRARRRAGVTVLRVEGPYER